MEKPDYLCFYSTNLDSNITALYDYIRKNKLDQKYGLRLFFFTTETRKFLYKNFDKNKIIVVNTARGIMSLLKC
ncbi:MAG: hypothetical protein J7L82_02535, partial [Staphylothermus sp.]|nr:hypothetical protein [Staphylothermus sp.]